MPRHALVDVIRRSVCDVLKKPVVHIHTRFAASHQDLRAAAARLPARIFHTVWKMLSLVALANSAYAPSVLHAPSVRRGAVSVRMQEQASPFDAAQKALAIFQASKAEGQDFKQSMADAIAGEYDRDAVTAEVKALASSAPMVLFTWESSPACKKALKLIAETGVSPKIVRLDDPWSEGNVKRAALGRLTGKSSVPSIWIGGEYIGGCDDGPSDAAPGLVPMAFRGTLKEKLDAAGAFEKKQAAPTESVA